MAQQELAKRERWPVGRDESRVEGTEPGRRFPRGPSTCFLERIARPRLRPYTARTTASISAQSAG